MGQFGWDFIAQGTGPKGQATAAMAIADGNGGGGFDGVVLIQIRARWRLEFRGTGS